MTRKLRCALFDLDNTLYPQSCGLMQEIGRRINLYMVERLGVAREEVGRRREALLRSHGTTLNGLRRVCDVDPDEYLDFVHDIPIEDYLEPSPELEEMLRELPLRRVIFTNADAAHARRVLARLGVLGCFETIIDIHFLNFVNKPYRRAYQRAIEFVSVRPEECVLLEDSAANIQPALEMGMTTVMVGGTGPMGRITTSRGSPISPGCSRNWSSSLRPGGDGQLWLQTRSRVLSAKRTVILLGGMNAWTHPRPKVACSIQSPSAKLPDMLYFLWGLSAASCIISSQVCRAFLAGAFLGAFSFLAAGSFLAALFGTGFSAR